ncbi:MAG: PepSY-associated TM helix domain-containing protein [Bacteroidota bacterium]
MIKFFKKYHKWLSIVMTIFILVFSVSGIILNHRNFFSFVDVNRNYLPQEYRYNNWNNAAVKGTIKLNNDSILIFGNIGVWLTDSSFTNFTNFSAGFPKGIDNKKISKIYKTKKGGLFAGTYFGLFKYDNKDNSWHEVTIPIHEKRIVDITEKGDTLLVLSRSNLLKSTNYNDFDVVTLPEPENYDNKIGLFKTLWVIHSGELYGITGKLIVDLIGLIFIFLTITGFVYFINRYKIKNRKKKQKKRKSLKKLNRWYLKWHNKIGWITLVFLIVTTVTGMFLRPPLLIAIVYSKVDKIPFTKLDSPNPWYDKLRRIYHDEVNERYIIATLDAVYYADDTFSSKLKKFKQQPPLSIMGVNVFEPVNDSVLLIGSFEGLFLWNTNSGSIIDYIEKKPYKPTLIQGPPIGNHVVTGYSSHFKDKEVYFDFGRGAKVIGEYGRFVKMPLEIEQQPMSLWNAALEFHTARIYTPIFGSLYILIIPIAGFLILFILISGTIVWFKKHRKNVTK